MDIGPIRKEPPPKRIEPQRQKEPHPLPAHLSNYVLGANFRFSSCFKGNRGTPVGRVREVAPKF